MTNQRQSILRQWLPAVSLGFAAFIFVTTELVPVGLLPDIAAGLGKSESVTGLLLTAYAWVVALMSLPLTVLSARYDRRKLLIGVFAVFIISHFLASLAPSYGLLMAARICIALSHAIFWSITTPLVTRVAPQGKKTQALGIIVTGVSLATVLGVPLGTMIGHLLGWRITFAVIGVTACLVLVVLARLLPPLPSSNAGSLASVPLLFRRRALVAIYGLTVLTVTGHFTAFTYLAPFFEQVGGYPSHVVVYYLLILGGSGIAGSVIAGKYAESYPRAALIVPLTFLTGSLACLYLVSLGPVVAVALCFLWGASLPAVTLVFQTRVLSLAPDAADVAVAMYSGIFNIGIGGGALVGSQIFQLVGLVGIGFGGAIAMGLACTLAILISLGRSEKH